MDELKISDEILEKSIDSIKSFYARQCELIKEFSDGIRSLSGAWDGPNFDRLLSDAQTIEKLANESISSIRNEQVKYLREKVELFRRRPSFKGCAPRSSNASRAERDASSSAKTPKTIYDKIFAKHNEELVRNITFYLRKKQIRFYPPDEGLSFYDPDGISRRGLYKNIMCIDINSPQCESQLMSLTGQHIYFQIKHQCKAELLRSLSVEMNSKSFANDVSFQNLTKRIKSGEGIDGRFLKFANDGERYSFNFFTRCFQGFMTNNESEISEYKRYYSNSYRQFKEILTNLETK